MNLIYRQSPLYRIGVDVGGTNTDAAILDVNSAQPSVCASTKTPTTADITSGISTVIENVLSDSQVDRDDVLSVAIGTTHFVNAIVEANASLLSRVAVVRLCGPFTRMVPPFAEFPPVLKGIMGGPTFYLDGGLEIDGREIAPLNRTQIKETITAIQKAGIRCIALVGIFSAVDYNGLHEESCKEQMLSLDPSLSIVCSHTIGGIGLLERENATILNASILHLARNTIRSFQDAMARLELKCTLYLTQNDGTLTDAASAAEVPIRTIASGPTNSMTGAAFLASLDKVREGTQVLVMDIGGTTSDICALLGSGFPRPAPGFVEIGGVKTVFSIPEVLSIGLGGGSVVHINGETVTLGPESVGHELMKKALVFGGDVLTATDIVVACGKADIGDKRKVEDLDRRVVDAARKEIRRMLEGGVDEMKISEKPVTVLLVGGGAILQMDDLKGVEECVIPPHHGSANAVGAAIAKVVGEVDVIAVLANRDEDEVVEEAKKRAIQAAVAKGADPKDVKIVEVTKIPLAYVTGKATRLIIKAVGRLSTEPVKQPPPVPISLPIHSNNNSGRIINRTPSQSPVGDPPIDLETYRPDVRHHIWYLSATDLEFIATGTGVLGTGGGGPSRLQYLECIDILKRPGTKDKMRIIPLSALNDSDTIVSGSWYGAPSVSGERIPAGHELATAMEACVRLTGQKVAHAAVTAEIGGGNGMSALPLGVASDIPVVDGDMMGRAFPTMAHSLPLVYGGSVLPIAVADGRKNVAVVTNAENTRRIETMLRSLCEDMGNQAGVSAAPFAGAVIKKYTVPNTISQAWYIGRAIHRARRSKSDIIQAIFDTCPGKLLYSGKIIDVTRDVSKGYTMGTCIIAPLSKDERERDTLSTSPAEARYLSIPFQNEYLYAAFSDPQSPPDISKREVICTVPDLISVLGQDGEALGSQELRYGLKVHVIGMPAHPLWATQEALKVGGPRGFGFDMDWVPLGGYRDAIGVGEEFNP